MLIHVNYLLNSVMSNSLITQTVLTRLLILLSLLQHCLNTLQHRLYQKLPNGVRVVFCVVSSCAVLLDHIGWKLCSINL